MSTKNNFIKKINYSLDAIAGSVASLVAKKQTLTIIRDGRTEVYKGWLYEVGLDDDEHTQLEEMCHNAGIISVDEGLFPTEINLKVIDDPSIEIDVYGNNEFFHISMDIDSDGDDEEFVFDVAS